MDLAKFASSLAGSAPPSGSSVYLKALWFDGKGDWTKAHDQVDQLDGKEAARVHAYLHRKEGDSWNADYWYQRAGTNRPDSTLAEEWNYLVKQFL